jgi:catalase
MEIAMHPLSPRLLSGVAAAMIMSAPAFAEPPAPDVIVDAMQAVSGKHKARASGAKGQCVTGTFKPAPDGAKLSKSPMFAGEKPVLARFSMGGGNPAIPDFSKVVTRGFAMRIDPDGDASEFVFISAPVFAFRTPEQMVEGLKVRAPGPDGKPDAAKIKAFTEANPETAGQSKYLSGKPIPASFAATPYWGVHAFTLKDAAGKATVARLAFEPQGGEQGLSDDEAKAKGKDFYVAELTERLKAGPAAFDLVATVAKSGDALTDATAVWTDGERQRVTLGTLSIAKLAENADCDARTFDPTILAEGLAGPKDDPMFEIRSPAYAVSVTRRLQ